MINAATDNWMRNHRGQTITIHYIPGIVREAFPASVTDRNAIAGITCTGISPFNRNIFTAVDYAPSSVTDRPLQTNSEILCNDVCSFDATTSRGRKKRKTAILTDTPENNAIEEEYLQTNKVKRTVLPPDTGNGKKKLISTKGKGKGKRTKKAAEEKENIR